MFRAHPASTTQQKAEWLLKHKEAFLLAIPEQWPGLCVALGKAMRDLGLYGPKTTELDICYSVAAKQVNKFRWVAEIKFQYKLSAIRRLTAEEIKLLVPSIPPVPPPKPKKPRIVCLCGSSRFIDEIALKAWEFEKSGAIVLGMHLLPAKNGFPRHHAAEAEGPEICAVLDELHLRKIDLADFVFVMNVDGYIGERTRIEIEYARTKGKMVDYLHPGRAGR